MEQTEIFLLGLKLRSLAIFRGLRSEKTVAAFQRLLEAKELPEAVEECGAFAASLYLSGDNWSRYLLNAALEDENLYVTRFSKGGPIPPALSQTLLGELEILAEASRVTPQTVREALGYRGPLPLWETETLSFPDEYQRRMETVSTRGYGIFSKHYTFLLGAEGLRPVRHPDDVSLSALSGYETERQKVIDNTAALLEGKPAANALLYGDAGTGKSTTVKVVANLFADRGLRLIELQKEQLREIPRLLDQLAQNPLKFIFFIDDLSFTKSDDNFSALKAVLEGSVAAKADNIVIYATSNRRHLIRESFADREAGDDVHRGDTMQELVSLSDRFGLSVTFLRPDKKQYASIVTALAKRQDVCMEESLLLARADAYALRRSGYSPRVAKQFIESLRSK